MHLHTRVDGASLTKQDRQAGNSVRFVQLPDGPSASRVSLGFALNLVGTMIQVRTTRYIPHHTMFHWVQVQGLFGNIGCVLKLDGREVLCTCP